MTTAKTILDNIMTRIGMYSAIGNYFTSTEIHAQEVIRLLNALLKELTASVNFKEMLEPFDIYTYKEWKSNEALSQGDIRYVLSNAMDGNKYEVVQGGISTTNPSTVSSEKGDTFTTSVTKAGIGSNLYPPSDTISDTDLVVYDTDYQNASLPDSTILAKVTSKIPATNIFIASTNNRDSKLTSLTDWKDYVKTFIEKSSNRIQDIIKFVPKPIVDFFVKNLDFELTNNVLIRK